MGGVGSRHARARAQNHMSRGYRSRLDCRPRARFRVCDYISISSSCCLAIMYNIIGNATNEYT